MADSAGEWCLIESDPGVFTELIRGFGKSGVFKISVDKPSNCMPLYLQASKEFRSKNCGVLTQSTSKTLNPSMV